MTTINDTEVIFKTMLYQGERHTKRKRNYVWRILTEEEVAKNHGFKLPEIDDQHSYFCTEKNLQSGALVGGLYLIPVAKDDHRIAFIDSGEEIGIWENTLQVSGWQTAHYASFDNRTAQTKRNKQLKESLPMNMLEPFRVEYAKAGAAQKRLILAHVIAAVTTKPKFIDQREKDRYVEKKRPAMLRGLHKELTKARDELSEANVELEKLTADKKGAK